MTRPSRRHAPTLPGGGDCGATARDAWERLKTLYPEDKKASTENLLAAAGGDPNFRNRIETEARELTDVGNKFMIRHAETDKIPFTSDRRIDSVSPSLCSNVASPWGNRKIILAPSCQSTPNRTLIPVVRSSVFSFPAATSECPVVHLSLDRNRAVPYKRGVCLSSMCLRHRRWKHNRLRD